MRHHAGGTGGTRAKDLREGGTGRGRVHKGANGLRRALRARQGASGRTKRSWGARVRSDKLAGPQSRRQPPTARTGARRPSPQLGSRSNLPPWSQGTACGGKGRREVRARPVRGCQSGSGQGQEVRQSDRDGARWRPRGGARRTSSKLYRACGNLGARHEAGRASRHDRGAEKGLDLGAARLREEENMRMVAALRTTGDRQGADLVLKSLDCAVLVGNS